MDNDKNNEKILEILNSPDFDMDTFTHYFAGGLFWDDDDMVRQRIECITCILYKQYDTMDLSRVFEQHDTAEIADFINRLIASRKTDTDDYHCTIPREEAEEFLQLAIETEKISLKKMIKTSPLLTTNTYLEMCRVVYDAASLWKYPEDISTPYLYCDSRMLNYEHEYNGGILGIDRDSPEEFALMFSAIYHNEELWFGGPKFYIHDESARLNSYAYTMPEKYAKWSGWIYCDPWKFYRGIKMFVALRKKGYPVYFDNYNEVYNAAIAKK